MVPFKSSTTYRRRQGSHRSPYFANLVGLLLTVALLQLFLALPAFAADQVSGVITGKVTNGTTNQPASGLDLRLETYLGHQLAGSLMATTSAGGEFRFPNLDTQPSSFYVITTEYKGIPYSSETLLFQKDQTNVAVQLSVYETGASAEAISTSIAHTVISPGQGNVSVLEFESVSNISNMVYVPSSDKDYLKFFLPPEAGSIEYLAGLNAGNTVRTDKGVAYSAPLKPGNLEVAYRYTVPNPQNQLIYARYVFYPSAGYSLLVKGTNARVESSLLERQDPVTISGESYQHFTAGGLTPSTYVMVNLTVGAGGSSTQPNVPLAESGSLSPILLGSFAAILLLVILFLFLRKRHPVPADIVPEAEAPSRELLLDELARLDDRFEAGQIEPDAYRKLRAAKKAELLELMQPKR